MDPRPHALYRFYADDGALLYVGNDLDQLLLALTGATPDSGPWGTHAEHMPDECQRCRPRGIYLPYRWTAGHADYQCAHGHRWTCWWGHPHSGDAPTNRGREAT